MEHDFDRPTFFNTRNINFRVDETYRDHEKESRWRGGSKSPEVRQVPSHF